MAQQRMTLHLTRMAAAPGRSESLVSLDRATFARLSGDQRGAEIRCARGMLWVTQPGDSCDYILRAGERMIVSRTGAVLVQALTSSAVQLTPADRRR